MLPTSAKQALDLRIEERTPPMLRVSCLVPLPKRGGRLWLCLKEHSRKKPCTQLLFVQGKLIGITAGHNFDDVIPIQSGYITPPHLFGCLDGSETGARVYLVWLLPHGVEMHVYHRNACCTRSLPPQKRWQEQE